jgi:hypothetical protein
MSNCYTFRHRVPSTGSLVGPEIIYELHRPHWNEGNINTVNYIHFASTNRVTASRFKQFDCCLYSARNLRTNLCLPRSSRSSTTCTVWLCLVTCRSTKKSLFVPMRRACTSTQYWQLLHSTLGATQPAESLLRPVLSTSQMVSDVTCNNLRFVYALFYLFILY